MVGNGSLRTEPDLFSFNPSALLRQVRTIISGKRIILGEKERETMFCLSFHSAMPQDQS